MPRDHGLADIRDYRDLEAAAPRATRNRYGADSYTVKIRPGCTHFDHTNCRIRYLRLDMNVSYYFAA